MTRLIALLLALTLPVATSLDAQRQTEPLYLPLRSYAGTALRSLTVSIAGRTGPFIFDTGAGITLLNASDSVSGACTPFGRFTGFRATGQLVTSQRCGALALGIGTFATSTEMVLFDLAPLLGKEAPPIGGLLALSAFAGQALTLDYANNVLIVETRESLAKRVMAMRPISARLTNGAGGDAELFLEVRAKVGTLWLHLDSGNNGPVLLSTHAFEQLGLPRTEGRGPVTPLEFIGLGPVPLRIGARDMIYDGQLNPAFLEQVVLTIDFQTRRAWAAMAAPR